MKRIAFIYCCFAILPLFGADWPHGQAPKHAYLEVIVANLTSRDVSDMGVWFGTNACTKGIVGAGVSAGYLGWTQPITTNATVRWVDAHLGFSRAATGWVHLPP